MTTKTTKKLLSGITLALVASIIAVSTNSVLAASEDPEQIQKEMAALLEKRDQLQVDRDNAIRSVVTTWDTNDLNKTIDAYAEYKKINRAIKAIPDQYKELGMKYNDLKGYETILVSGTITPSEEGNLYNMGGTVTPFTDTEAKLRCDLQFDYFSIGGDVQDGSNDVNFQNNFASSTKVLDWIWCNNENWESPHSLTVSKAIPFAQCTATDSSSRTASFSIDCGSMTLYSGNIVTVTVQADYDIDTISVSKTFTMS